MNTAPCWVSLVAVKQEIRLSTDPPEAHCSSPYVHVVCLAQEEGRQEGRESNRGDVCESAFYSCWSLWFWMCVYTSLHSQLRPPSALTPACHMLSLCLLGNHSDSYWRVNLQGDRHLSSCHQAAETGWFLRVSGVSPEGAVWHKLLCPALLYHLARGTGQCCEYEQWKCALSQVALHLPSKLRPDHCWSSLCLPSTLLLTLLWSWCCTLQLVFVYGMCYYCLDYNGIHPVCLVQR